MLISQIYLGEFPVSHVRFPGFIFRRVLLKRQMLDEASKIWRKFKSIMGLCQGETFTGRQPDPAGSTSRPTDGQPLRG